MVRQYIRNTRLSLEMSEMSDPVRRYPFCLLSKMQSAEFCLIQNYYINSLLSDKKLAEEAKKEQNLETK